MPRDEWVKKYALLENMVSAVFINSAYEHWMLQSSSPVWRLEITGGWRNSQMTNEIAVIEPFQLRPYMFLLWKKPDRPPSIAPQWNIWYRNCQIGSDEIIRTEGNVLTTVLSALNELKLVFRCKRMATVSPHSDGLYLSFVLKILKYQIYLVSSRLIRLSSSKSRSFSYVIAHFFSLYA